MAPTTHTETHPLVFGQEVSFGSIAGPTDFIDVFVDANMAKNAIVEWRVYATVGSLVSCVGTSPGGGSVASVLKWSGPQGPYSPLAANGSLYELRAYWAQPGPVPTMKASIVGYDEFDTVVDTDASASEQIPASFAEVEFANAVGYSQFADVAVTQQFTGNVNFTLYALAEAGASRPLSLHNLFRIQTTLRPGFFESKTARGYELFAPSKQHQYDGGRSDDCGELGMLFNCH